MAVTDQQISSEQHSDPSGSGERGAVRANGMTADAVSVDIGEQTWGRLQAVCARAGLPAAASLCAIATVVLSRYSGWDDVSFGVVSPAPRSRRESVGARSNVIELTISLGGVTTFEELLRHVGAALARACVEDAVPSFSECHFDLCLRLPLQATAPSTSGATEATPFARVPVLSLRRAARALDAALLYDGDTCDMSTMDRLGGHLMRIAHQVADDPSRRLADVEMLDEAERSTLLVDWNSAPVGYEGETVHELFMRQAKKTPQAVALEYRNDTLTYAELDERANRLARFLQRSGVGLEVPVGVCLDRSPDAVVAILAILKAGGAYVPLDPEHPRQRLDEMVRDSRMPLLVTRDEFAERLSSVEVHVVSLTADADAIAAEPATELRQIGTGDNAAYLLYTSGSTGQSKAVIGIHRSIVAGLSSVPFDRDDVDDVCCVNSSLSFGFTVARLFLPLFCGHRVVIVPDGVEKDLLRLVIEWERADVGNIAIMTPLMKQLLNGGEALHRRLRRVRTIVVGGAVASTATISAFREALPHATLLHGYAATEIGVAALVHAIAPTSGTPTWSVGTPFPNTRVYILDRHLNLTPIGLPGELCIAAPHLARAYLRRPRLTAERFVANPFGDGERLYRTGDVGRYLPNGEIEILGRADDQVKIRGFRIELPEIESRLAEHPDVQHVAVTARKLEGEPRLIAYVTRRSESRIGARALREYLASTLPRYMVPSVFMFVDAIPLTATGKVDRSALPPPTLGRQDVASTFEAPRTECEASIAAAWQEALGVGAIGVHDHFLDLGGDSLQAMQISVLLTARFGVPIHAVLMLSECATVADLAAHIVAATPPGGAAVV